MFQWTFYGGKCQHLSKEVYFRNLPPFHFCVRERGRMMPSSLHIVKNVGLSFPFFSCMNIINNHICVSLCKKGIMYISHLCLYSRHLV